MASVSPSVSPSASPSVSPSASPVDWFLASTLTVTTGSIISGVLEDTYSDNDIRLVLAEIVGTPGFAYDFTFGGFEAVPTTALFANFCAWYDGNPAHIVKLQQWNYNTTIWVDVTADAMDFEKIDSEQVYQFRLLDDANYISGGEIQLQIVHNSPGNPLHAFHIDYLYLSLVASPSASPSESPSVSPSESPSLSPSVSPSASPSLGPIVELDNNILYAGFDGGIVGNIVINDLTEISINDPRFEIRLEDQ